MESLSPDNSRGAAGGLDRLRAAYPSRIHPGPHGDTGGDGGTHANAHSGAYADTGPQCRAGL